jgi:hypothetical protein
MPSLSRALANHPINIPPEFPAILKAYTKVSELQRDKFLRVSCYYYSPLDKTHSQRQLQFRKHPFFLRKLLIEIDFNENLFFINDDLCPSTHF